MSTHLDPCLAETTWNKPICMIFIDLLHAPGAPGTPDQEAKAQHQKLTCESADLQIQRLWGHVARELSLAWTMDICPTCPWLVERCSENSLKMLLGFAKIYSYPTLVYHHNQSVAIHGFGRPSIPLSQNSLTFTGSFSQLRIQSLGISRRGLPDSTKVRVVSRLSAAITLSWASITEAMNLAVAQLCSLHSIINVY